MLVWLKSVQGRLPAGAIRKTMIEAPSIIKRLPMFLDYFRIHKIEKLMKVVDSRRRWQNRLEVELDCVTVEEKYRRRNHPNRGGL